MALDVTADTAGGKVKGYLVISGEVDLIQFKGELARAIELIESLPGCSKWELTIGAGSLSYYPIGDEESQ
jgi:hypothetical protein